MRDIKNDGAIDGWTACPAKVGNPFSNPVEYSTEKWSGVIKDLVCMEIGKPFYRVKCEAKKEGDAQWHAVEFQIQSDDEIVRGADPIEFAIKWVLPILATSKND